MGQKINPNSFRLATKPSASLWFDTFKKYSYFLKKDNILTSIIKCQTKEFGINKIRIKRQKEKQVVIIHIHVQYPHLIFSNKLLKLIKTKNILLKVFKIENILNKINLLAEIIIEYIQERISFQRIIQKIVNKLKLTNFKGIKIQIAGRLMGIEKAKTEWYRYGKIPLNTINSKIEYTQKQIATRYGSIGLKLWLVNKEC